MGKGLWINSKIIKPERSQGHVMKYCVYTEDGDVITMVKNPDKEFKNIQWNNNGVCFASLIRDVQKLKIVNRVMYFIQDGDYKNKLDDQEKADWVTIAKHGWVLPGYVTEDDVLSGTPVIKLVDVNPSLLYIYLSSLRVIQENPSFVRAMLYLVAVYRMNFCAAWVLASRLVITNSWHNIVEIGRYYCQKNEDDINELDIEIRFVIGLQRYMKDPWKYDSRTLLDKNAYPYKVHSTISKLCRIKDKIEAGNLFEPCVLKAIDSETDEKAMEYLRELK